MMRKIDERSQCTEQADVPRSVSSVIGVPRKLNMKLVRPAELTEAVSYQLIRMSWEKSFLHSQEYSKQDLRTQLVPLSFFLFIRCQSFNISFDQLMEKRFCGYLSASKQTTFA